MPVLIDHIRDIPKKCFSKVELCSIFPHCTKNVSLVYEYMPPHTKLPPVLHRRTDEMVYCLRGMFTACIGNKIYHLNPGNVVWIPKKTRHSFATGSNDVESLSLFIPAIHFDKNPDIFLMHTPNGKKGAKTNSIKIKRL